MEAMVDRGDLSLDPKEIPVERREGSLTSNTKDVKVPKAEGSTSANAAVSDAKSSAKAKDKKKKKNKCKKLTLSKRSGKHGKAKSKKGKKAVLVRDTSSESSDSESGSDSVSSSSSSSTSDSSEEDDSDEGVGKDVRLKPVIKNGKKTKKLSTSSAKKGKKSRTAESLSADSSDTDDDASDSAVADKTIGDRGKSGKKQRDPSLQQQLQQLQRQVQQLESRNQAAGLITQGGPLNTAAYNGVALGNGGYVVPGFQTTGQSNCGGFNTGAVSLGGINGTNFSQDGRQRGLGNAIPPIRGHPGRTTIRHRRSHSSLEPPLDDDYDEDDDEYVDDRRREGGKSRAYVKDGRRRPQRLEFKRVDQVWDSSIHNYKLQDTAENVTSSRYDEYLFHVRRTFDWEGKYKATVIDIKSKQLREALQDVMGNIKGVSLVEETPKLDPNMLFLYLEDLREHMVNLKDLVPHAKSKKERKKVQKWINEKRRHLRVLVKYLDKDYAQVKKSLYPLLDNGLITFDLCWALWKPNTLAYTTTYGSADEPRVFKVDVAEKHYSVLKGEFYYIEGKYFEYDGKQFGYGSMSEEMGDFRGARKISSLGCYPLKYHKNEDQLREQLIERGKKFVSLAGAHYKSHQGMGYYKKKKSIIKVNINGRIMVDPSTHRRNNPNYPISVVRPKDHDLISDQEDSEGDEGGACFGTSSEEAGDGGQALLDDDNRVKFVTKVIRDKKGQIRTVRIPKAELSEDSSKAKLDNVLSNKDKDGSGKDSDKTVAESEDGKQENQDEEDIDPPEFADEEYLIASPVVLGFAFAEKLWLELSVSGVGEISWNESAYDSLVLEPKTKDIVKALVESHKYHAAESIDDVIQGKGKGLVFVLHGPPGTGKTLTAEGISELLKCPLYNVSAGDLGTDSRLLEVELQKVLDICHAWGAILLLDEADVFLEKRNMHDIHRNALVSIFLRQLEYFQGILFLTTNRVETFDDAFQSRIHIALRYDELDTKAKKAIFKIFIDRVRAQVSEAQKPAPLTKSDINGSGSGQVSAKTPDSKKALGCVDFTDEDYNTLARHTLNGRQIKNTVRTAQALAVQRGEPLSMKHITQFLDVLQSFERDLKGGTGYQDAMRSYF
ncbi:hypothetical protein JX265_012410 [Neoarthrinium moseri]|uniref:AAA+ ATPase domain-containing protein n=1 Tax=Neoarthrinium moseri TaxID=1658444 RepID=A0A9P9WAJ1_9PEZI|nr:hypothetical protein JX265_012410 [Neoarthrinium moseri]